MLILLVFVVGGPTLPTEILADIVSLAAPGPEFDFVQTDWAQGIEYATLKALCLSSRVFNDLATPLLYSHLVVPTAERAQSLITALESDEWQTGERAGKANEWIEFITIGSRVEYGQEVDGVFVQEVLSLFIGGVLARLSMAGVTIIGTDTFNTLEHLRFLQLAQVAYRFPVNDPPVTLDKVTHLHASDPRMIGDRPFLEPLNLHSLTHFASRNTVPSRPFECWLGADRIPSALKFLAIQQPLDVFHQEVASYSSKCTHLKNFALLPSFSFDGEAGFCLHVLLGRLPNPLGVLDLAALSSKHASSHSTGLSAALRQNVACLNSSTVLRLPGPEERGLRGREGLDNGAVQLGIVADLAEERGMTVEWV